MSKLSVDQMCQIAGENKEATAESLQIKQARFDSFLKVGALKQGVDVAPIYQVKFWELFEEFNGDFDVIRANLVKSAVDDNGVVKPLFGGELVLDKKPVLTGKRFVFTSAQNNTPIHHAFFASLLTYCEENEAELIIGKFVYNKNGFQNGVSDDNEIWYAEELQDYFKANAATIIDGLDWCGELNILPTAKYPLSSLEQYTGQASCIVPHAKLALESVATLAGMPAKLMYTTGAITQHNYIQKKTGQMAQAEHCYGALAVEINEEGSWFCRQIQTDETGAFQDLTTVYHPDGLRYDVPVSSVTWGDLHSEKIDMQQVEVCQDMLESLKPSTQFFHDAFDMTSRNHHNRKSGHFLMSEHVSGSSVEKDLRQCNEVLGYFESDESKRVIVESNHDLALELWLDANDYNFRLDPVNALTFLNLQTAKYNAIAENNEGFNLLEYGLKTYGKNALDNMQFLKVDESCVVSGVEQGLHGHIGANGSKGSPKQFRKFSMKCNTGHTHTASIHGGVYTAGVTGSLEMGYNKGASSWSHSHIITYKNGQRAIVTIPDGENWRV